VRKQKSYEKAILIVRHRFLNVFQEFFAYSLKQ
jgi:hypothetical protein